MSCFDQIKRSEAEWDWRQCRTCWWISKGLLALLSIGTGVSLWHLWSTGKLSNLNLDLYTVGYLLDIAGGWFLAAGFSDLFAFASSSWGGGGITFSRFGKNNFRRRSFGLLLLTVGFIFQCVANVSASPRENPTEIVPVVNVKVAANACMVPQELDSRDTCQRVMILDGQFYCLSKLPHTE